MDNVLIRLKPELKSAIEKIRKFADHRFHVIAAESGTELKSISIAELNSAKLGIYSANGLEIGHPSISKFVERAKLAKNIKYLNGVLFIDVEQDETEHEPTIEYEPTTEPETDGLEFMYDEQEQDEIEQDEI